MTGFPVDAGQLNSEIPMGGKMLPIGNGAT
jgi:hypothetical protein